MSWSTNKSVVTYADLYARTNTLGGNTYTLKSGQTLPNTKKCIRMSDANTILNLDQTAIPSGLDTKRLAIRDWVQPPLVEQTVFTGFASPGQGYVGQVDSVYNLWYADPSLDGVIWFDPTAITSGTQAHLIPIPATSGTHSRPTGSYLHPATQRMYVTGFRTGGMVVIDVASKTIVKTIAYGTDQDFSRGNVMYIQALDEIWAVGNTGFLRIRASDEAVIFSGASGIGTGAVFVIGANGKIFVFKDQSPNKIDVYQANSSLTYITSISTLCQNVNPASGTYVCRGNYVDTANNRIYAGETSTTGGVIVVDTINNIITARVTITPESGHPVTSVSTFGFHPIRNALYAGGSVVTSSNTSDARLWLLDTNLLAITNTIAPSVNSGIGGILYYPPNNSVYVSSPGLTPESGGAHVTDGIIFQFN